jgi:hypothetical protein
MRWKQCLQHNLCIALRPDIGKCVAQFIKAAMAEQQLQKDQWWKACTSV